MMALLLMLLAEVQPLPVVCQGFPVRLKAAVLLVLVLVLLSGDG